MSTAAAMRRPEASPPEPLSSARPLPLRALFIAMLGTIVEYYDYALYGFCAAIMADHFFGTADTSSALFNIFAIFATGSFAKPVGALFFGYIGDYYGRKTSLRLSMIGIAIPTIIIGVVPSSESIGGWAAIILLLCRFSQGFFVAGESDGVRIFVHETLSKDRKNLSNGLVTFAALVGAYIATLAGTLVAQYPEHWQIPFLIGGALGFVVIFLRGFISETPEYEEHREETKRSPWWAIFSKENFAPIIATMMICGAVGGSYHFYFVFWGSYISKILNFVDTTTAASWVSTSLLTFALFTPLAGLISDKFGGERVFRIAIVSLLALFGLNIATIINGWVSFPLMVLTSGVIAFLYNPAYPMMIMQFKVVERYRCLSFGHAIGSMLFSGGAPALCTLLCKMTGNPLWGLIYFAFILSLAYGGLTLVKKHTSEL